MVSIIALVSLLASSATAEVFEQLRTVPEGEYNTLLY